jgi:protein-L-isoaspartate(D-aspartate) O-methyltransferase
VGRFDDERREMVELLLQRGIGSKALLAAMERIERHLFVPEPFTGRSYEDSALPIGRGQTISQPYTVAIMTEALDVRPGGRILEIGTGSGYQAAILAELGARVYTIERDAELLAGARKILDRLGYRVAAKMGDGTVGWSEFAPYDGIIVTAGAPEIPEPLQKQLADGGKMVIPVGDLEVQRLAVVTRHGPVLERHDVDGFKFVPLIGKMGWSA